MNPVAARAARRRKLAVLAMAWCLWAPGLAAQTSSNHLASRPDAPPFEEPADVRTVHEPTFATDWETVTFIGAPEFRPVDSTTTWLHDGQGYIYRTGGATSFWAPIHLPPGASVGGVCYFYYDNAATDIDFNFSVFEIHQDGPPTFHVIHNGASAGASGTYRSTCLAAGNVFHEVANYDGVGPAGFGAHRLVFNLLATNDTQRFGGAYIQWQRTITPAPGVATFSDVPLGHPYFQFVEAMWAARISYGCGPIPSTRFCPDAPVTHGQLALYLARALGLYSRW